MKPSNWKACEQNTKHSHRQHKQWPCQPPWPRLWSWWPPSSPASLLRRPAGPGPGDAETTHAYPRTRCVIGNLTVLTRVTRRRMGCARWTARTSAQTSCLSVAQCLGRASPRYIFYCQVRVQSPKVKTKRTWADSIITWATHPTHPLSSMKECSGKKSAKSKSDSEWPPWLIQPKNWPGGQRDQGRGVVLHVQEEVYQ